METNTSLTKKLLIVDGYGFFFRAYYGYPPLKSLDGQPLGAIYGFTSMLLKLIGNFKPKYAVMVLDSKGRNFRHSLFKEYKAQRSSLPEELVSQFPIIKEAAEALSFYVVSKKNFEADDIIATLAKKCTVNNHEAIIVSSDKDLLQLMDDGIRIYDPVKLKFISQLDVLIKFGVLPNKLRDFHALVGDKSDNVPGVKGIGPKTASRLINDFGSLEGIYNCINQIKNNRQRDLLLSYKTTAFLAWQLVGLISNVDVNYDLDLFSWRNKQPSKIIDFITKYKFDSLGQKIKYLH